MARVRRSTRKVLQKWMFPSQSTSGRAYVVTRCGDWTLSCNCPAWTFKRPGQVRGCLHVAGVLASRTLPPLAPFGAERVRVAS